MRRSPISRKMSTVGRLDRDSKATSSFRGAGFAREPGIQEYGPEKSIAWPVFMGSGPAPYGPSRNDTRVFQRPVRTAQALAGTQHKPTRGALSTWSPAELRACG
jgi:hypothetical protein